MNDSIDGSSISRSLEGRTVPVFDGISIGSVGGAMDGSINNSIDGSIAGFMLFSRGVSFCI